MLGKNGDNLSDEQVIIIIRQMKMMTDYIAEVVDNKVRNNENFVSELK